jgi:hypothetical protein
MNVILFSLSENVFEKNRKMIHEKKPCKKCHALTSEKEKKIEKFVKMGKLDIKKKI